MKVVHLNTYDGNGGAGRAALRLNKALNTAGLQSSVLSLYSFNPRSGAAVAYQSFPGKMRAVANIFAERFLVRPFLKNREVPFSLNSFGFPVHKHPLVQEADIIHLHWINHGFLAERQLQQLAVLNKKIVWTMHDSNPVTGGCHVKYDCQNYKDSCGNCPVLVDPAPQDLSHRVWKRKAASYKNLDITFIGPSRWMTDTVRNSSLGAGYRAETVPNSLEMDVFRPLDKEECKKELGFDAGKKLILAGFMPSQFSRHKGLKELIGTLKNLSAIEGFDLANIEVCFFGAGGEDFREELPMPHRFTGVIRDDALLVKYYNAADVFILSSLDENLPYTAMESLACGTPVAAFDTCGVSDVVQHGANGYLADLYDTAGLALAVVNILKHGNPGALASYARRYTVNKFSPEVVALSHQHLYNSL